MGSLKKWRICSYGRIQRRAKIYWILPTIIAYVALVMCLPMLSLFVFTTPICSVEVIDIWQCAGARLLQQMQLLEVIKDRVLAQLAYKFPSQVMMECSYKFLFLSAFFRDIKYFFLCLKNGRVNLQMWVNELAFGSRKLKIWKVPKTHW